MDGLVLLAADGLKVAKEGRKMPSVKCLLQESSDNSKPNFIMGHSFQVLSLLVAAGRRCRHRASPGRATRRQDLRRLDVGANRGPQDHPRQARRHLPRRRRLTEAQGLAGRRRILRKPKGHPPPARVRAPTDLPGPQEHRRLPSGAEAREPEEGKAQEVRSQGPAHGT